MVNTDKVYEPLTIRFEVSVAQRNECNRYIWLHYRLKRVLLVSVSLILIALLLYFVRADYLPRIIFNVRAWAAGLFAGGIAYFVFSITDILILGPFNIRRLIGGAKKIGTSEITWLMDFHSLTIATHESSNKILWKAFDQIVETESMYLFRLSHNRKIFYFVPKYAVAQSNSPPRFFEIVALCIKDKQIAHFGPL